MAAEVLADPRTGRNGRHSLIAQLRQSVFGRLAGYEDVNDADRLGRDPVIRWIVGGRAVTAQYLPLRPDLHEVIEADAKKAGVPASTAMACSSCARSTAGRADRLKGSLASMREARRRLRPVALLDRDRGWAWPAV